jgi:pilus assembly protein CpaE
MLALNLANELRLQEHRPSLLMDLDMDYGGASSYVGLRSNYTVADLLRHTGEIDAELISSSAQEFQDQLDILVSPAALDPLQSEGMDFGRVDAALEAAKIAYSNTVADSPRLPFDVLLKLAGLSEAALLIMQLTVKDLRLAALLLRRLQQAGIGRERVFAVVNRYRKRGHLVELSTARESLDGCSIFCVRNDFHNAIRSYDYGQPLAECAPRSPLRKDVAELAQRIKALPRLTRSYLASGET